MVALLDAGASFALRVLASFIGAFAALWLIGFRL
jgi:hypothetical protein